jgi:anionic cell wall polymer biosynthesis LytR-Cps2A-Psr (LCP) family protein
MARQKCVMNAMLRQLDPTTVVTRFGDIAKAGKQVISTSIPRGEIATFVSLAMKAKNLPVSTVSFVPPTINTGDPDWQRIRTMVAEALEQAEAADDAPADEAQPGDDDEPKRQPGRHAGERRGGANASQDLAHSC